MYRDVDIDSLVSSSNRSIQIAKMLAVWDDTTTILKVQTLKTEINVESLAEACMYDDISKDSGSAMGWITCIFIAMCL